MFRLLEKKAGNFLEPPVGCAFMLPISLIRCRALGTEARKPFCCEMYGDGVRTSPLTDNFLYVVFGHSGIGFSVTSLPRDICYVLRSVVSVVLLCYL